MPAIQRIDSALDIYVQRALRDVHTNIRGKIVDVDYSIPSVTVQPDAYTEFDDGTVDKIPPVYDVPLQQASGNGGKARLTMPVKAGDPVGLSFSERNENDNSDTSTHGIFAGWASSSIYSDGNAKPIDPNNVVLENDKASLNIVPEGDFIFTTPVGTLKVLRDGNFSFDNGSVKILATPAGTAALTNAAGGMTLAANGETNINGGRITPDGNFITAQGVNLNAFYSAYLTHVHGGVERGGSTTNPPS